jgi:AIPR protein
MKPTTFHIPVFSLRRIETPYERNPGYKNYVAVVDARHLPDLSDWREINVREAKMRGRVPTAIRRTFDGKADEFLFMNRGLVLAAERVDYRDEGHTKRLDLVMRDPEIHGLLDGGHTYRVVTESAKALSENDPPRYVRVEIVTGFDRDTISDVVEARNTSNQVKDESLANLRQEFEPLKKVLEGEPYYDLIAWSEYEELDTGKAKPIDVRDIISYLISFDTGAFNNSTTQPLIAYKDKRACLKHFQNNQPRIHKYYHMLPDILKLWDEIHASWAVWYGEGREEEAGVRGRFGKLTAIMQASEPLFFKGGSAKFRMPEAYKYPILSALRAAVKVQGRGARWVTDPFQLLAETGPQLTTVVGNTVRATNNPNKVGKDVGTWSSCYLVVESALQSSMTQEAEKKIQELEAQIIELKRQRRAAR